MSKATIKVYHNDTNRFSPYQAGDMLVEAMVFESPLPACGSIERLLDIVWDQLNIDAPTASWAVEYRQRRNRSLSVGDVVSVGEQAWAVGVVGWTLVSIESSQVWSIVGTTADGEAVNMQPVE